MKLTLDIGQVLDLTPRVVDIKLSMGSGETPTNLEVQLLDLDYAVRQKLTERTKSIKGVVGVAPTVATTPTVVAAVGTPATTNTVTSTGPITAGFPTGYRMTNKGIPLYPTPPTVAGRQLAIIAECLRQGVRDLGQIAYVLATVSRECGTEYKPIAEFYGETKWYAPWFGRGLVQLTHRGNYEKYKALTGFDLIADPEAVIRDFGLSAFILVHGSKTGAFTGRKLGDYINGPNRDFWNARRVINGTDHASDIAGAAEAWLAKLPTFMQQLGSNFRPSAPSTAANSPTPTAAPAPSAPVVTTGTATAVGQTADYPEGDKMVLSTNGGEWELTYSGYTAGNDGTITLVGVGARSKGGNNTNTNKHSGLTSLSVPDIAAIVATSAKAVLELDLEGEYTSTLVNAGGLTPSQLLAKLAGLAGLTVTDTGAKLLVREKFKVKTHTLDKVVDWRVEDKPVSQLSVINGNQVRAFPTTLTIPLAVGILAGDFVSFTPAYSELFTVERVQHDFTRGLTKLDCYVDFEANQKLLVKSSVVAIATPAGSALSGVTTYARAGASGAVLDPTGARTSRGVPRVRITSTASEAIHYSGQRNKGASSADGPDGGNQACAWSVNKYCLEPVYGRLFGNEPGLLTLPGYGQPPTYTSSQLVTGVQASTRKVWGATSVPVSQAHRGCICICLNSFAGHVGITIEPNRGSDVNSLSNSSRSASWTAVYMWQAAVIGRYPDMRFDYINMDTVKQ